MNIRQASDQIRDIIETEYNFLAKLPEDVISERFNNQNRSIKMLVGHLVDSASNNHQRIVRLQYAPKCGWSMPDANVGMLVFPDYTQDNDLWIQLQDYQHYDWTQLLTLWRSVNLHIANIADRVDQTKLDNYWIDYQGNRCTLGQMIEGDLSHLKLHIGQIHDLAKMDRFIAFCGLDCKNCDAYIATVNNDNALREKTAKLWCEWNNTDEIKPEHINCLGCRTEGIKTYYCSSLCKIRKCAESKGYETCKDCSEKKACKILGPILNNEAAVHNILGD